MVYINLATIAHVDRIIINCNAIFRGGFRGGVRGVRPPPKIRKAYVIQR